MELQVLPVLEQVAPLRMLKTYVASFAQLVAVSSLNGLNPGQVVPFPARNWTSVSPPVPPQELVMIPWPFLFFQKPMVSAPVWVLQTVTLTFAGGPRVMLAFGGVPTATSVATFGNAVHVPGAT